MSPDARNSDGNSPLHSAAVSRREIIRVIRELIHAGADVNLRCSREFTPLHYAVCARKPGMVKALLKAGADVNAATGNGNTPLHYAINTDIIWENKALHFATNKNRFRALYVPAGPNSLYMEIIKLLLQHEGINVDVQNRFGSTPLSWAVEQKKRYAVRALLEKGADPNISSNRGRSPLHVALDYYRRPCIYIVHLLLQHGADLYSLCSLDQFRVEHGADLFSFEECKKTPIDFLMEKVKDDPSLRIFRDLIKIIAFHRSINENEVRKLERIPECASFYLICTAEVSRMRTDSISRNLTIHDFISRCLNEDKFYSEFDEPCLEIYKPLVDILMIGHYSVYLNDILRYISKYQLWNVFTHLFLRKAEKYSDIHNGFLRMSFNSAVLSDYLSYWDIFQLILSVSNQ